MSDSLHQKLVFKMPQSYWSITTRCWCGWFFFHGFLGFQVPIRVLSRAHSLQNDIVAKEIGAAFEKNLSLQISAIVVKHHLNPLDANTPWKLNMAEIFAIQPKVNCSGAMFNFGGGGMYLLIDPNYHIDRFQGPSPEELTRKRKLGK